MIPPEESDLYQFGMECMLLKFVHYISYAVIAFVLRMPVELIIMGAGIFVLRKDAGGYHADTKSGCYIFSCFVVFGGLTISKILCFTNIWYCMVLVAEIFIIRVTPIDNCNKILDLEEKNFFRKRIRKKLLFIDCIWIYSICKRNTFIFQTVSMSILIIGFLLKLGMVKNNKCCSENL